jgi:glutamine cyclotransferase
MLFLLMLHAVMSANIPTPLYNITVKDIKSVAPSFVQGLYYNEANAMLTLSSGGWGKSSLTQYNTEGPTLILKKQVHLPFNYFAEVQSLYHPPGCTLS